MIQNTIIGCAKSIFFSLILVFPSFVFCQGNYLNVQIPPVNKTYSSNECEPSITINPINPNEIAAGSILAGYHYSSDAGKTWASKEIKSPYGVWGEIGRASCRERV